MLGVQYAKVFNSSEYTNVLNQFQNNFNSGGSTFSRSLLDVLPNQLNGVMGGYQVDLLIVLLQTSNNFLNNLPAAVKSEITYNSLTSLTIDGAFNNFPHFSTSFQNITGGGIQFSLEQINLLSTYTDWYLNQEPLKSHIDQMFRY